MIYVIVSCGQVCSASILKIIALFNRLNGENYSHEKLAAFGFKGAFLFRSQFYKSLIFNVLTITDYQKSSISLLPSEGNLLRY